MLIYIILGVFVAVLVTLFVTSKMYVIAQPNEWMIVLREGKLLKCGVGISCFQGWNDKVVRFPSKIHKVPFSAQQVTTEMQGVEVSGIIIWSIYRDADGPLRAYKSLGADIHQSEPVAANQNLIEMASGIVRHKIANSTINQILKNRQTIREDIKKELNKSINGWGVWLETVEITDVKILSASLFENLQTEFRESQRQKAEIIGMKADNEMKEKKLLQNLEFAKKEAENETKKQIIKSNELLRVNLEKQKNYELDQELQKQKLAGDQALKQIQAESKALLQEKIDKNTHELVLKEIEINIKKQIKNDEITRFETTTNMEILHANLANQMLVNENRRDFERRSAEERRVVEEALPFDVYALEKVSKLLCRIPLNDVKIFNFSNDGKNSSAGNLIQQVLAEYQVIKTQLPQN